jgi:hypothetical protein
VLLKNLIGRFKNHLAGRLLCVDGYAFLKASKKNNVVLSSARAAAVHDYFVTHGLAEDQVVYAGHGFGEPDDRASAVGDGLIRFRLLKPADAPYLVEGIATDGSESLKFVFSLGRTLKASDIEITTDGPSVLMIRLRDAQTDRRWIELKDKSVMRALLHPSTEAAPAAVLRIRMNTPMPKDIVEKMNVVIDGQKASVTVPRW